MSVSDSIKNPRGIDLAKLSLGALGVVYGDIGTSPLYALKESFSPSHGLALNHQNILGILSLVFWSLTLVVTIKYLFFIMRADIEGEGGITALMALLIPKFKKKGHFKFKSFILMLGLIGTGLLFGDGVITPAISVLSAVEGLKIATPGLSHLVLPITIGILIGLFWLQKKGTAGIGAVFGPLTLLWFITIAGIGLPWIFKRPEILEAINPVYAIEFFKLNGIPGFLTLNSVVLCITGGEALYADMGHFGVKPIKYTWFALVFPALLINYFGQGALVLEGGESVIENTFYGLVSGAWLYPLVIISTIATVIASQALISGVFSLAQQCVQLGYLPRTTIIYTSRQNMGQIYVPKANLFLMIACVFLVLSFGESSALASAYGIAVTGTMGITSILFFWVCIEVWGWSWIKALIPVSLFLVIDAAFFGANISKVFHGGWVTLSLAGVMFVIMTTWKRGRDELGAVWMGKSIPLKTFFDKVGDEKPFRIKGTAVFMSVTHDIAPVVLLKYYAHNKVLHEKVLLLSIITEHTPEVRQTERVRVTDLDQGFVKVVARYGYMETPDVAEIMALGHAAGLLFRDDDLHYFLGREIFVTNGSSGMAMWRKKLFVILSRNARYASEYFNLPADRVIELGSQIQI